VHEALSISVPLQFLTDSCSSDRDHFSSVDVDRWMSYQISNNRTQMQLSYWISSHCGGAKLPKIAHMWHCVPVIW